MKTAQGVANRPETIVAPGSVGATRQPFLAVMILLSICVVIQERSYESPHRQRAWVSLGSSKLDTAAAQDYSRFSHSSPREHADLMGRANCGSCHRRTDGSLAPKLPVHKDCMECHLVQFTARTSSDNPICSICHTRDGLNSTKPPAKTFPGLSSFNAKFDHAQHLLGIEAARPGEGCAACHTPANRGTAKTIPARLSAHQSCYECHSTGQKAGSFSSCGSCHDFGRYSRTPATARAYRVGFRHTDHSARQHLACETCHNVKRRGLPQAQQVSSILAAQHFPAPHEQSCKTCHNSKRAFGDIGPRFTDCKRCHRGLTFRM
jgi:hypothetical protein